MAIANSFPPDVPNNADEVQDAAESTVRSLRGKAAEMAGKASETVRDGYERAKDAWDEAQPLEAARESGQAVVRTAERHPLATLGLGAASIGLIAWAMLRSRPTSRWERYQPDYDRLRGWLTDYGSEAAETGQRALKAGGHWLRARRDDTDEYVDQAGDYAARARDYADRGGRMLVKRAEREPMAALVGLGLAAYVIGSLLSSASGREPAPAPARKRAAKR
ncbi:conserved hypothetical protein [Hyphomicrobiales bacterium]|nr:conserved hypothetical protein [Hyphomicrobiales bacterium]CAH1699388.1 conserved hypothetical protein [Hyphomicrobiales bacterium]CAI0343176.1 conserved hypothetical protein [Hyphomicrobiales bacterium]